MRGNLSIGDRFGAAAGAAYILLITIGNQLGGSGGQDPHPTGAADLADFSATPTLTQEIGFAMEMLGWVAFMVFLGWLVSALRSRGGTWAWLPGVAAAGGLLSLAVKLSSAAPIMTGELNHGELSELQARILADLSLTAFLVTFLPFAVFVLAAAASMLATGFAGRVAGWSGVVIGGLGVVAPVVVDLDPLKTNPFPFILAMAWTLAVSVRLSVWGPRSASERRPEPAAVAGPMAAEV